MKRFAAPTLAALLAGCAGGTTCAPPAGAGAGTAPASSLASSRKVRAAFVVHVPRHGRRLHYVSLSTKSIRITADPGTPQQQIVASNLALGTNTVGLILTPGPHAFNVATYDGALNGSGNPTGNLLSVEDGLTATVVIGSANAIGATLQGVPSSIVVSATANQDVSGDQLNGFNLIGADKANGTTKFPRSFSIVTTDADGNYIVGAGAPAISATSSNTSVLSNGSSSGGNSYAFTPGNNATFPASTTITIMATPGAGAGAGVSTHVTMTVTNAFAPRIYAFVSATGKTFVYDENGDAVSLASNAFSATTAPLCAAYDPHNNSIYAYDGNTTTLYRFDVAGNALNQVSDGNTLTALAYGNGEVYGGGWLYGGVDVFSESLVKVTSGLGNWYENGSGKAPGLPASMLVDTAGHVDILDNAASSAVVQQYDAFGNATSVSWAPTRSNQFASIVQDPVSTDLYVSDESSAMQMFDPSGNVVIPSGAFAGMQQAAPMAWDSISRRLYVWDQGLNTMFAFDGQGNTIVTTGGFPGLNSAPWLVVVP